MNDKFLVLANSYKKISETAVWDTWRCVAGIRIKENWDMEWIRVVDPTTETWAIPKEKAKDYLIWHLFDIVSMGDDTHKKEYQWENKIVKLWTDLWSINQDEFSKVIEKIAQTSWEDVLWISLGDRVSEFKVTGTSSLKLIIPQKIQFYHFLTPKGKKQIRCKFSFDDIFLRDIVVTDGLFIEKYRDKLSVVNEMTSPIYLVTSLWLPYQWFIYLLAASIIFPKCTWEEWKKDTNKQIEIQNYVDKYLQLSEEIAQREKERANIKGILQQYIDLTQTNTLSWDMWEISVTKNTVYHAKDKEDFVKVLKEKWLFEQSYEVPYYKINTLVKEGKLSNQDIQTYLEGKDSYIYRCKTSKK